MSLLAAVMVLWGVVDRIEGSWAVIEWSHPTSGIHWGFAQTLGGLRSLREGDCVRVRLPSSASDAEFSLFLETGRLADSSVRIRFTRAPKPRRLP